MDSSISKLSRHYHNSYPETPKKLLGLDYRVHNSNNFHCSMEAFRDAFINLFPSFILLPQQPPCDVRQPGEIGKQERTVG